MAQFKPIKLGQNSLASLDIIEGQLIITGDTKRLYVDVDGSNRALIGQELYTKVDGIATGATKVEASSTNGNIKINGTETTVYTHPGSGTNPHGTTKSDVGLGNVGNFKAVSTVANQGLTNTEKSNARTNIGAGTSNLTLGTTSTTAAKGDHTHTTSLATDTGTSTITLAHNGKYKLTAGGTSVIFTMPGDNNTTYTFATGDSNGQIAVTPSGGTKQNISVKGLAALAYKASLTASEVGAIATTAKGTAGGVAELDANGKVPTSQLPSFVDDVIEGYYYNSKFYKESAHTTEITGEAGKIYVDLSTNKTYRYSGSAFVEISSSLALGETSSTAYRGDRGKIAYDHSQSTHARTDATAVAASATNGNIKINGTETTVYTHPAYTAATAAAKKVGLDATGHVVLGSALTASDVGLGNVGNFKAVSTVASQGLTDTEKSNARTNIGAGTSNLTIGTTSSTAAAGNHTHTLSMATDTGTSSITLAHGGKYKLTAGGSTYVFTMPSDNNTTYTFAEGSTNGAFSVTPSGGTAASVKVHGLANAAYKGVDTSMTTSSTSTNVPTTAAVAACIANSMGVEWTTVGTW